MGTITFIHGRPRTSHAEHNWRLARWAAKMAALQLKGANREPSFANFRSTRPPHLLAHAGVKLAALAGIFHKIIVQTEAAFFK